KKVDRDALVTMSVDELFAALVEDKSLVTEIVHIRPSVIGELIQKAFVTGSPLTAMVLVNELRKNTSRFGGTQAQLLVRSIMRVEGPGAEDVRAVMQSFVDQDNAKTERRPWEPHPAASDYRTHALAGARTDPGWAKLSADYYDRPEAAAQQLLREAHQ